MPRQPHAALSLRSGRRPRPVLRTRGPRPLAGYSLTTAEILYRLPDYPSLLQTYVWQEYDIHPYFPRLQAFLNFWSRNIEGKLFRVTVAHTQPIAPAAWRTVRSEFSLH